MNDVKQKVYRYIQTTTFIAFINRKLLDSSLNYSKNINITTNYNKQNVAHCVDFQGGLIEAKSNKWRNMACMRRFNLKYKLHLKPSHLLDLIC